ncbi:MULTISPECIES: hypothetical protein [unclassified Crossiella]|uniref:hypothetical protein n=1 Tax=unclassified Crossiella TaxID=2620835 RepID=UPI001FFF6C90|nr:MULTISPECIES: hypothetical protein [unclassified Crossiella]MCK2243672.1 hypothetical protein [Crossiella sp. S99.2]MCK2257531.1 hypothetical protein [Crossiella sp. S99.1]
MDNSADSDADSAASAVVACASLLDTTENAFRLLTTGPQPLAVDGVELGHGLPARLVPLSELRDLLLAPRATHAMREAAWVHLVCQAQTADAAWVVGAVGVALPGLRAAAGQLAFGYTGEVHDLDAEVLTGFCDRLKTIDPDAGMLAARLIWAAQRAGARLRATEWNGAARQVPWHEALTPTAPAAHPDLVLAAAVSEGVLTWREAAVIGATRLEGLHLVDIAPAIGLNYRQIRYLRAQAEQRLVAHLTGTSEHNS